MEDAIIINKASAERGFAHGSIYKSEFIELDNPESYFCRDPLNSNLAAYLDTDGLPFIGRLVKRDEPLYCYYSEESNRYVVKKFKGKEECYINNVKFCGGFGKGNRLACISFRVLVSKIKVCMYNLYFYLYLCFYLFIGCSLYDSNTKKYTV